jgi:hypothetical protein
MDALQAGIAAAREGRRQEARELLQRALQANPRSQQGWLWMSGVVDTDDERRICLEQVLTINPHNQTAQIGLEKLNASHTRQNGGALGPSASSLPADSPGKSDEPTLRDRMPEGPLAPSAWPHTNPTQAMRQVTPPARRIERLEPDIDPMGDDLAGLRAAQAYPSPSSSAESDPFMAAVLIGGLSITALGGALMLALLWLIGWPP